ncbi:LysM peptidoglycan-binding domain-containing protein [bacterium D16-54]|nr:LysM peptidoglycan-binding domain-containing protein [bacterium D16-54]RKJ11715.1 LysM peptidoglycan-binding domain-containing protein [bacterium D16-56]
MAKTRTILIKESGRKKIELTINPAECTITDPVEHIRENVDQMGQVSLPGKRGLKEVAISTFLPDRSSPFYDGETIKGALKLIERWKKKATKLRIIISDPKINFKAMIDSDSVTLKEGQKDVYVSWKFTEYKPLSVPTVESIQGLIQVTDPVLLPREEESAPETGRTETVTSKTTLWSLAVKYYGDGSQWTKISAANGNIDPKKLKEGMVLTIP